MHATVGSAIACDCLRLYGNNSLCDRLRSAIRDRLQSSAIIWKPAFIHPTRWKSRERKRQMLYLFIHLRVYESCSPRVITKSDRGVISTSLPTICQPPRFAGYLDIRQRKNIQRIIQRSAKNSSIERSYALSVKQQSIMEIHRRKGSLVGWILGATDTERKTMSKKVHSKNDAELRQIADPIERSGDCCQFETVNVR